MHLLEKEQAVSPPGRVLELQGPGGLPHARGALQDLLIEFSGAGELAGAGTPPGRLDTSVRIVMDEVEGQGHQIVASQVEIAAAADGVDAEALAAAVAAADEGCPFSMLLKRAGVQVDIAARLA